MSHVSEHAQILWKFQEVVSVQYYNKPTSSLLMNKGIQLTLTYSHFRVNQGTGA